MQTGIEIKRDSHTEKEVYRDTFVGVKFQGRGSKREGEGGDRKKEVSVRL